MTADDLSDLTPYMVAKGSSSANGVPHHAAGEITAWDEKTLLPIVRRRETGASSINAPATGEWPAAPAKTGTEEPKTEPARPVAVRPVDPARSGSGLKPAQVQTASSTGVKPVVRPATMPDLEKGQPVELADGSRGTVAHVIQNMRSVRVRTADGRNVTVGRGTLKVPDSVFVKQHFRRTPG